MSSCVTDVGPIYSPVYIASATYSVRPSILCGLFSIPLCQFFSSYYLHSLSFTLSLSFSRSLSLSLYIFLSFSFLFLSLSLSRSLFPSLSISLFTSFHFFLSLTISPTLSIYLSMQLSHLALFRSPALPTFSLPPLWIALSLSVFLCLCLPVSPYPLFLSLCSADFFTQTYLYFCLPLSFFLSLSASLCLSLCALHCTYVSTSHTLHPSKAVCYSIDLHLFVLLLSYFDVRPFIRQTVWLKHSSRQGTS